MTSKRYVDELERALARSDANKLIQRIDAFIAHYEAGNQSWPDHQVDDFVAILDSYADPEEALAYVVLAASRTDDGLFLAMMGAGPLEDMLCDPCDEILARVVAEARKSARFRWLLNVPFKIAVSERTWEAISPFRVTGPHEEPHKETLPARS